jgi:hypothetical protein
MSWTSHRARVAVLSRTHTDNDPILISAREALAQSKPQYQFEQLTKSFSKKLKALAPLTDAQVLTLMALVVDGGNAEVSE